MKKLLSIVLSVVMVVSTIVLLSTLPTTAEPPVNLIVNGSAEGASVGDKIKQTYDATDAANSAYPGEIMAGNVYGFRNCSNKYANISHRPVSGITTAPAGYFTNFTGKNVIGINTNQQLYQDVEIEKNKAYTVSVKISQYPNKNAVTSDRFFDVFLDNKAGTIDEQFSLPSGKSWNLATGHPEVMAEIKQRFNNPAPVSAGSEYYGVGDFLEYSFTFKARDFIEEYGLTPNQNGKYDARLVIHNRVQYILLAEDISVIEADMSQFLEVSAGKGGTVLGEVNKDGGETDVTAVAYYGNKFLGWYDEDDNLVSENENWKGVLKKTLIARFTQQNMIVDGDFESGDSNTLLTYLNYPRYAGTTSRELKIGETAIAKSGKEYGKNALYITPDENPRNEKIKDLLSIPVSVESGKTYIWKFSYAFPKVAYDASKHYIHFSVDKAVDGDPVTWGGTVEYAYHVQRDSLPELDTNSYTWSKNTPASSDAAARTFNVSAANEWVHMYVIFTADTTDTYHLTLGAPQPCVDTFLVDNLSCTEATTEKTATEVLVEGEGTVTSYRVDVPAYRATENAKTSTTTYETLETAPYFSQMYETLYANAGRGYYFVGWYDMDDKLVSSDKSLKVYSVGEKYTAKFAVDTNKYKVNVEIENKNGVFGGYVTDNLTGGEYFNGDTVLLTAHSYKGNKFVGFYDGETLLSTYEEYEHTINKDATITARFETNNLFTDSSFENTDVSKNLLNSEWTVNGSTSADEAVVVSTDSYKGEKSLFLKAPAKDITSKQFTVSKNTAYHLAFDWRSVTAKTDENSATLNYVKVLGSDGSVLWQSSAPIDALGSAGWQNFYANFNTLENDAVRIVINYSADAGALFLDDLSLFPTASALFDITADVEKKDEIYPAYIVGDKNFKVGFGESVTVTVVPYEKNTFLGWFYESVCLSTDLTYTFAADSYLDLKAKFEVENIFPDAGFENTKAGVQLGDSDDGLFRNNVSWGSITANESAARTGKYGVEAVHRNNEFNTFLKNLKQNTDYELTFWWKVRVAGEGTVLDYVEINGVQTGKVLSQSSGAQSSDEWQQVKVVFNTKNNTDIKVDYKYTAGSTSIFLDDFTLCETNDIKVLSGEGGTVSSSHTGSAELGEQVTVTATETTGKFLGWYDYLNPQIVYSTEKTYTFTVEKSITLIAYFEGEGIAPINYFVDGDFENDKFAGAVFSHPWGSVDACTYSIVSEDKGVKALSGDKMLKINNRGNYVNIRMPNLKPSTDYTLTFYWNAEATGGLSTFSVWPYWHEYVRLDENRYSADSPGGYTKYLYYDADSDDVIKMSSAYILGAQHKNDGWEKVVLSFNSDNTNENMLHFNTYGAHKILYLDNITLTEGGSGYSEELVNGDFSEKEAENGWLGSFEYAAKNGNSYAVSGGEMQQNLILETADAYTISFRAKAESADAEIIYGLAKAGVTTLTEKTALSNVSYEKIKLTSEWKNYELTFSTWNFTQYSLFFRALSGSFAIDDVEIFDAKGIAPVQTLTFEETERLSTLVNNVDLSNKTMNNRDWYEYSKAENHTANGAQSLLMKYKEEYAPHAFIQESNVVQSAAGRTYHVSFYAKSAVAGNKFRAQGRVYGEGWKHTYLYDEVETVGTEWQKFEYYYTVPFVENWGGPQTHIMVDGVENGTIGDIYFDDFVIEESERSALDRVPENLYTQNLSQNYFYPNYHFEDEKDAAFGKYTVKADDAFYGDKYLTVKAGDKIVVPVKTRQDWALSLYAEYTLSAAVRGDKNAKGTVGISYTPDGNTLIKDKAGNEKTISINTNGKWEHKGISFVDNSFTTVYFVIECTGGSFSLDYISLFNNLRGCKENTDDHNDYSFDADNPENYVDMSDIRKENFLMGVIKDLPEGSSISLLGAENYSSEINEDGEWEIRNIKDGKYNLFIKPSDCDYATFWGDITLENGVGSGLGMERLDGSVIKISGQGVDEGIVKLRDDITEYGYLSLTDKDGYFTAYILDSDWSVIGTTDVTEIFKTYSLNRTHFGSSK